MEEPCTSFGCKVREFITAGCPHDRPCIWYFFGAAYAVLAVATLVQLIRMLSRLGEFGWTMQKVFHLLNLMVCVLRATALFLWNLLEEKQDRWLEIVMFNVPNLLFFSTYTLLPLFWAEIVHATRLQTSFGPRFAYGLINLLAYVLSVGFFIMCGFKKTSDTGLVLEASLQLVLDVLALVVFVVYGYMLLKMLVNSSVQTPTRKKKTIEISLVTFLATFCFLGKAVLEVISIASHKGLDYSDGLLYDSLFYGLTEILVIATSLGILSGMPAKGQPESYEKLPATA